MSNAKHQMSEFRLGLIFISTAVMFWGLLPIALKLSAGFIDPVTLTWFRFLVALVISLGFQCYSGSIRQFAELKQGDIVKLLFASIFLMLNYVSFVYSLDYLSPGTAQLNFQTAPFFLAFGGALFFKEKLNPFKLTCFATLALGILLFFHPYLSFNSEDSNVWFGLLVVQFSALSWTSYALLQKSMLSRLSPANILLFIYGVGVLVMVPFSELSLLTELDMTQWWIVLFCALNTLVAYGCFGQAMKYWPTAEVSAMIALTPVLSFSLTALVVELALWPNVFVADSLDGLSMVGIAVIIASVMVLQLYPRWRERRS